MTDLKASPLGRATVYTEAYDPALLFPVDRADQRASLNLGAALPFRGVDLWTAYELSWLDPAGKPRVAVATFSVPHDSPRIVESKSVKMYLTAFNMTRFASPADVAATIARDLGAATGARVEIALTSSDGLASMPHAELEGESLDELPFDVCAPLPDPTRLAASGPVVVETVFTRLFRSVCPVTGQPDFASMQLRYRGPRIDRAGLLAYFISFRRHPGFHEHCVERIFADVWRRCGPVSLAVYARFTRRGGIDINPWRTSGEEAPPENARTAGQ